MVLEFPLADLLDPRSDGHEEVLLHALVGVADILGHQGEEDLPAPAARHLARQQVEQEEERALATGGDGDVLLGKIPAEFPREKPGDGPPEARPAGRSFVDRQHALQTVFARHEFLDAASPDGIHLGDERRLAAAEHADFPPGRGQRRAQIIHELADPAAEGEAAADLGELEWHRVDQGRPGTARALGPPARRPVFRSSKGRGPRR